MDKIYFHKRTVKYFLFLSGSVLLLPTLAYAGQVKINATRDYCHVEVREGKSNQPDANNSVHSNRVSSGWSYTGSDGNFVCYRREGNPGICPSGMGYWVCNGNPIPGVQNYDLY